MDQPLSEDSLLAKLNLIGSEIKHEDNLIGARMSWLVISQSFLFGTFATLVGLRPVVGPAEDAVRLLITLIPLVGVMLPILVLAAVGAAMYAISQWRAERTRIFEMPEAKQLDWARLDNRGLVSALGQLLPIAVSVGFLLAWIVILIKMV